MTSSVPYRPAARRLLWRGVLLALALIAPRWTRAAGEDFQRRGDDLVVTGSSRWCGCSHGGYYPIRIQVRNMGVDCTVRFEFTGNQDDVAAVQRTLTLAQNSTVKFTLPVPCVGTGTYGTLNVYRDGRFVEGLEETLSLPDVNGGGTPRPALLVISPTNVDCDPFESAVTSTLPGLAGHSASRGYSAGHYVSEDHQRIEPTLLPEEWIAYSGLDIVAVPMATLLKFTGSEQSALLKWVQTGGSLLVYDVGQPAAQSQELARILEQPAAGNESWQPADVNLHKQIRIIDPDEHAGSFGGGYGGGGFGGGYGGTLKPAQESSAEGDSESEVAFQWPESADTFAARDLMLGRVYAFPENPFPGTAHDWNWLLSSMPAESKSWPNRHGISARIGSDEFLQFLIPSVQGVPVIAFLLLITLFTVVIGPLNYIWLWKRRRLYLLVLTIPAIALCTSLVLFGYSAVAHGFSTKSRSRTVTFVDQPSRTAVTNSRIALYAGLAPSDGLRFSQDTAVMPIWPDGHQLDEALTDWTEQQNLRSAWLKSRTRTQFLTVGHRDERGRLEIASPGKDRLQVTNGFEWGFSALIVSDADGRLYYAADFPAGASAELAPITSEQRNEFAELLKQHPLQPPESSGRREGWFDWNIDPFYQYDHSAAVQYSNSQLEQLISLARNLQNSGATFPSSSYTGVLTENPGITLGVERTRPQASLHVLMGRY